MKKFASIAVAFLLCLSFAGCEEEGLPQELAVITGVELVSAPAKSVYLKGEPLTAEGGRVKITYSDGSTISAALTDEMLVGDTAAAGEGTVDIFYTDGAEAVKYGILVVDRKVSSAAALGAAGSGEHVLVEGDIFGGLTLDKDLFLYGQDGAYEDISVTIAGAAVTLSGFRFTNKYEGTSQGTPALAFSGAAKLTLKNVTLQNASTDGSGALYGLISTAGAADGSRLAIHDSTLIDAHFSAGGDTPSIVGGGAAKTVLDVKNSTFTAKSGAQGNASNAFFNGAYSGAIEACVFSGVAINSVNLDGLKIVNNVFEHACGTQLVLGGSFALESNVFAKPANNDVLYAGIYGFTELSVKNNSFALGGGDSKHYGVRFAKVAWGVPTFPADKLAFSGNAFMGEGHYAVRYDSSVMAYDFWGNTLNGNIIKDDSAA